MNKSLLSIALLSVVVGFAGPLAASQTNGKSSSPSRSSGSFSKGERSSEMQRSTGPESSIRALIAAGESPCNARRHVGAVIGGGYNQAHAGSREPDPLTTMMGNH